MCFLWGKNIIYMQNVKANRKQAVEAHRYCDVFGRMPSLLGNLKLDTPVVARQPQVKHFHGYAYHSALLRCMVA
jgi:hypothetical protein